MTTGLNTRDALIGGSPDSSSMHGAYCTPATRSPGRRPHWLTRAPRLTPTPDHHTTTNHQKEPHAEKVPPTPGNTTHQQASPHPPPIMSEPTMATHYALCASYPPYTWLCALRLGYPSP